MRRIRRIFAFGLVAVGCAVDQTGVDAAPLDPTLPFFVAQSQGDVTLASGNYAFTLGTAAPTLVYYNGPNFTTVATGFVYNGINVFDFHSLNVAAGANISVTQSSASGPIALLSNTSISMGGSINVSALNPFSQIGGPGASNTSGGGNGTSIEVPGGNGGPGSILASGGGGGGFGGSGQAGGSPAIYNELTHAFVGYLPGGAGGSSYQSLADQLRGGSMGGFGGGNNGIIGGPGSAGLGGGAIELGAVQTVSISGTIAANGGNGMGGAELYGGGGGGSGGGVFLHGSSVNISGTITALGGAGSGGFYNMSGGGAGSGGLILAEFNGPYGSFTDTGTVNVGSGATVGRFDVASVPEPSSLILLGTSVAGGVVLTGWRRRRGRRG